MVGVSRRDFLKGSALTVGAISTLGLPRLPRVADVPIEPVSVGLRYRGAEVMGTGYKRLPLASVFQTYTPQGMTWDAADVTWTAGTFSADEVVLFGDKDQEIHSIPISPASCVMGDFTIQWHPNGIYETV